MLLEGLFLPLTTPFYPDGRLNLRKLEHNVERYSRTPAAGLALLTPTGEGDLLTDGERLTLLRAAVEIAAKEKVLLADCSRPGVSATLELLHAASELGYDAALLRLPAAVAHEPEAIRRTYVEAVVDRTPIPLLLAEERGSETWLAGPLLRELARTGEVLGWACSGSPATRIPEALAATALVSREVTVTPIFTAVTRRMLAVAEPVAAGNYIAATALTAGATALATEPPRPALRTRNKRVGFQVLAGESLSLVQALQAGARGALLPFAVCAPQAAYEVLAAWRDEDTGLATEKSNRLSPAAARLEGQLGPAGLKAGADRNGYFGGRPRLPLLPLKGAEQEEIESLLRTMRN